MIVLFRKFGQIGNISKNTPNKKDINKSMDKMLGESFGRGKKLKQTVNVKFSNVAGMEEDKKEII